MKKITFIVLLATMGTLLYSCASSIPRSDSVHESWAEKHWRNVHLSDARDIYASACGGCHGLHAPAEHTKAEWSSILAVMAGKARLSPRDSTEVIAYLETYSKDNQLILQ